MRSKILLFSFLFVSNISFGQLKAIVIDSSNNEIIPYVNIWVENANVGTTSSEKGEFTLNNVGDAKVLVFSCIGYETKRIKSVFVNNIVKLNPKTIELQEVIIMPKVQTEMVIGKFKKSEINHYFGCGGMPWIVARYFEFDENYRQTPFLKTIRLLTNSDVKDSKINIRLYSVNENGQPGDFMHNENIIGIARKGKKTTEIDVTGLNLQFPEKGFFMAVEWLIIESNKYESSYTIEGTKQKANGINYEPAIGTVPSDTDKNSWIFNRGKWQKVWKNNLPLTKYNDKFSLLAIELTLMN